MVLREPGVRGARGHLPQRTPPLNDPIRLQVRSNLPEDTPPASRGVATHVRTTSTPRRRSFPNLPGEVASPASTDPYNHPTREVRRGAGREGFARDTGVGRASGWQEYSGARERYRGGGEGVESARGHESSRASGRASDAAPTSSVGSSRRGVGVSGCPRRSPRQQRLDLASPTQRQTRVGFHSGMDATSSPRSRSSGIGAGLGEGEPRQGGKGSPQPPEFVLHVEEVLRWLGVEGVTPEVLRRAKRGLREEHVAAKMWRALLHVCLLHHDASREGQAGNDPAGGAQEEAPRTAVSSTPASRTLSGERGSRSARGLDAASLGGFNGRRGAEPCAGGAGVVEVPLSVAVETCGHLLSLWGYRRRAFAEAIRAGDTLETREILLALAWVMTEARVFHAFEQAHLVSPLPPPRPSPPARNPQRGGEHGRGGQSCRSTPHAASSPSQSRTDADAGKIPRNSVVLSPPPRFPRDVSETPEIAELAEEAFWKYLSDVEGGGGATRCSRGEGGGELAKALRAAREMMCCYGRLEGELRIVEGLEASRGKMLSRMRSLHKEVQLQRRRIASPSTAPTVKSLAASSSPQRHNRHHHNHEAAKPLGSNTSRADPYLLCLLAKPEEERHRVFSHVLEAREALESAERGRSHTGRWCRWVSSAAVESTSTSTSHANKGTLPQVTPSIDRGAGGSAVANPPGRAGGRDGAKDEAFASPGSGDGEPLAVGGRPAALARVELLQQQLESRIRELPTPPILASVWQSAVSRYAEHPRNDPSSTAAATAAEKTTRTARIARARVADLPPGQMPAREEDGLDSESVEGVLRRLAEGVDSRLGQQEFVRALEEGWQPCGPTLDGRQILPEHDDSTAFLGVEKCGRGRASSLRASEGARNPPAAILSARSPSVVRRELQEARRLHAEILAELLASCREVMPFHPRETGYRKPS